jgi:hypothetical protein
VIRRSAQFLVSACRLHVLTLNRGRWDVAVTRGRFVLRCWTSSHSAVAAVVADTVHSRVVVDDSLVVDIVYVGHVYVGDRAVVEEWPWSQRPPSKPSPK